MKSNSPTLDRATPHIAVLAAFEYEAALVRRCIRPQQRQDAAVGALWHGTFNGRPITLLRCGIGPERAQQAAVWLASTFTLQGLINIGFVGGLQPDLHTGDAVLAQHIQGCAVPSNHLSATFTDSISPSPTLFNAAAQAAISPTFAVHHGVLLSTNAIVAEATQKQRLGHLSNALAVDMEAHCIARVAIQQQVPFVSLKTVFDACDDDISLPFIQCTQPNGTVKLRRLVSTLVRHPVLVPHLRQQWRKAKTAGQRLEDWLARFLTLMSLET